MTVEERAEEWLDKKYLKDMGVRNPCREAYIAGYEQAQKTRWHYVKDGDLPKEDGDYLVYLYDKESKQNFLEVMGIVHTYADREDMHLESMIWTFRDVIAWCELPEVPKEK